MPAASIIIITRNRKTVAEKAVRSAYAQHGDVEVIVMDDASDDGTAEHLRALWPDIRVHRSETRHGYIVHRNSGARLATAPIIVSIDDDAEFGAADTVERIVNAFADDARFGAISVPHIDNVNGQRRASFVSAPDDGVWVVPTFIGTAYALRRDLFLRLGGFEEKLFHWSEEEEYCRRMLGAGYCCRALRTTPIEHHPHPAGRHTRARNLYIFRNRVLVPWFTAPMPQMIGKVVYNTIGSIVQQIRYPYSWLYTLEGLARGYSTILFSWPRRHPVPASADRLYEELRGERLVKFGVFADKLPPLAGTDSPIGVR